MAQVSVGDNGVVGTAVGRPDFGGSVPRPDNESRFAVFDCCPQCDGPMAPEHAHFRCGRCGWRDSCCD